MIREKHELIWLSAEDIAKQVGVSSMTIKRNCNTYEEFILFKQGEKNKYYISSECVDVLKFINKLRNKKNVPHKEILEVLDKEGFKKYIAVDMEVVQENTSKKTFEQTMFTLDEVRKIVAEELEKAMKDQVNKKDEQIMYLMREIQDLKRIMIEEKQAILEIDSSEQQVNNEEIQEIKKESWWRRMWIR
jgi:DNA-binding transcriptional MerR regulator